MDSSDDEIFQAGSSRRRRPVLDDSDVEDNRRRVDDSSEEEEEDPEEMRKIQDGFIVDDEEGEEEEQEEEEEDYRRSRKSKKKRKKYSESEEEELDDDEYDLVEENTGLQVGRSKLQRLHKRSYEDEDSRKTQARSRDEDLEHLFDDDDNEQYPVGDDYEDGLDDFIDDDEGSEDDELERPMSRSRPAPQKREQKMHSAAIKGASGDQTEHLNYLFHEISDYLYALHDKPAEEKVREKQAGQIIKANLKKSSNSSAAILKDVIEPGELKQKFMTDSDERIKIQDIPERLQLLFGDFLQSKYDESALKAETAWIFRHIVPYKRAKSSATEGLELEPRHVSMFLRFLNIDHLEVPTIWAHRKDFFVKMNLLSRSSTYVFDLEDLWYLFDLDIKYKNLSRRQKVLQDLTAKVLESQQDEILENCPKEFTSIDEINDRIDYIGFYYPTILAANKPKTSSSIKRPVKQSLHQISKANGVEAFLKGVSISCKEIERNLTQRRRADGSKDPMEPKQSIASKYISRSFSDVNHFIQAAVSYMAQKIGVDVGIRQYVRSLFLNESFITTNPTSKGASVIDISHPYFIFKHIHNKPLSRFEPTQFLQIADAEQNGLISIKFAFKSEDFVLDRFSDAYCSDSRSSLANEWNDFRKSILRKALNDHLIPYASKWMTQKLRTDGEEVVLKQIEEKFYHKVNMAPFRLPNDLHSTPKVLALTCGRDTRESPHVAVFVNSSSQLTNHLSFGDLRNDQSREDLYNFISKFNPDVAVISGLHYCTKRFFNDVSKIIEDYSQNNSTPLSLFWQTDETARLYQNSKDAVADYPNLSSYARYCISLARYCQNPVNEYASLGQDLTRIHLHPLQKFVNPNRLYTIMERVLINVVNECGVQVNQSLATPYKSVLLNYVSGLGPRKAQNIIKRLSTTTETPRTRIWFLSNKALTKSVFFSCASVLKIQDPEDVLDGTRIHPEDYALARKMAADALEIDEEESDDIENPSYYVEQLMNTRNNNLSELNLDEFSRELEKINNVPKKCTLSMICDEIQNPYYDHRTPYISAPSNELFAQLTGENPYTLHEDMRLPVEIVRQTPKFFICRTDSGLDGFLSLSRIPHGTPTPHEGQVITCVVTRVDLNRFSLELSLLPEDFARAKEATWLVFHSFDTTNTIPIKDEYFREPDTSAKPARPQTYDSGYHNPDSRSRSNGANNQISNHQLFKQFNFQEAEHYLSSKSIGDLVIRPSSSGNNHLSISWKMHESIYQHLNVSETNGPASTSINRSISIAGQRYENIEDMITSYINPCLMKIREVTSHPKYRDGPVANLKDHLQNIASQHPSQSVYGLCLSTERPGYVVLAYKINASSPVQDILVKITPGKFRLNDTTYPDITKLINGFKVMVSQRNRRN